MITDAPMGRPGRRLPAALAALLLVPVLAGCQSQDGDSGSDPSNPRQVEIVTWWTDETDEIALHQFIDVFELQNPELQVIDASVGGEGGAAARAAILSRLESGNPPDIVQVSAGAALSGYLADGALQDLSALTAEHGLDGHIRDDLLDLFRDDGKVYGVPVAVYRANILWSNRTVLADAGVAVNAPPADLDAWLADLARVRASGVQYPLALGNELTQVQLFEGVLLARLGPDAYRALWSDEDAWSDPAIRDAVDDLARLLDFADPADSARGESSTTNDVIFGDAAYVVMAAYAERQFQRAGWRFGEQYDAHPVPGTDGVFDVAADAFALPVGAAHESAAQAWLLTASTVQGQQALSVAKGSLPARFDVSTFNYPDYQKAEIAALNIDDLVPSLSQGVAASPRWTEEIASALVEFRAGGRVDALLDRLSRAAAGT
jgi:glucose/mannose transport system substrate-binding protein